MSSFPLDPLNFLSPLGPLNPLNPVNVGRFGYDLYKSFSGGPQPTEDPKLKKRRAQNAAAQNAPLPSATAVTPPAQAPAPATPRFPISPMRGVPQNGPAPAAPAASSAAPVAPASTAAPAKSTPTPTPQNPNPRQGYFDALKAAAKQTFEAELGSANSQYNGSKNSKIAIQRVGERYRNALAGIDAEERRALRVANQPAKIAAMRENLAAQGQAGIAAAATRRTAREARLAQEAQGRSAAFDQSYTDVEDIRNRGSAERTAAANAAGASTPTSAGASSEFVGPRDPTEYEGLRTLGFPSSEPTQSTQSQSPVKAIMSATPQGQLDAVAAPTGPQRMQFATPVREPVRAARPPSAGDIQTLSSIDPSVKARLAAAYKDPTSPLGFKLHNSSVEDRNALVQGIAAMSADAQLQALNDLEAQSKDLQFQSDDFNRQLSGSNSAQKALEYEANMNPRLKAARDQVRARWAQPTGASPGITELDGFNDGLMRKFDLDVQRQLEANDKAAKISSATSAPDPKTLEEHQAAKFQELNQLVPGMRLGDQVSSAATLSAFAGPMTPYTAGMFFINDLARISELPTEEERMTEIAKLGATQLGLKYLHNPVIAKGVKPGYKLYKTGKGIAHKGSQDPNGVAIGPPPPPPPRPMTPREQLAATKAARTPAPYSNEEVLAAQSKAAAEGVARAQRVRGLMGGPKAVSTPASAPKASAPAAKAPVSTSRYPDPGTTARVDQMKRIRAQIANTKSQSTFEESPAQKSLEVLAKPAGAPPVTKAVAQPPTPKAAPKATTSPAPKPPKTAPKAAPKTTSKTATKAEPAKTPTNPTETPKTLGDKARDLRRMEQGRMTPKELEKLMRTGRLPIGSLKGGL